MKLSLRQRAQYVPLVARYWDQFTSDAQLKAAGYSWAVEANLGTINPVVTAGQAAGPQEFFEWKSGGPWGAFLRQYGGDRFNNALFTFRAKTAGAAGNSITIDVAAGTTSGRKLTISDGGTPEVFDNIPNGGYTSAIASSALVECISESTKPFIGVLSLTGGLDSPPTKASNTSYPDDNYGRTGQHFMYLDVLPGYPFYNIWVRGFCRWSTAWNTKSPPGRGGSTADHKWVFLLYDAGGRDEIKVGTFQRCFVEAPAIGDVYNSPVQQADPSWANWPTTNIWHFNNPNAGWPGREAYTTDFHPWQMPSNLPNDATHNLPVQWGDGDNEWYEWLMHHNVGSTQGQFTYAMRKYTVGGVVNPQPWKIAAQEWTGASRKSSYKVKVVHFTGNRNTSYNNDMEADWGPIEVVNGNVYQDPFGFGFGTTPMVGA